MLKGTSYTRRRERQGAWAARTSDLNLLQHSFRFLLFNFFLFVLSTGRAAAEEIYDISIASVEAAVAIKALSRQTGHAVIFQSEDVDAVKTNPVSGRYSLQQALKLLLGSTVLSGDLTKSGVITISPMTNIESENRMQKMNTKKGLLAALVGLFSTGGAVTTIAEESIEDNQVFRLEEIIVSARRIDENLQDVPIAITAVTGDDLLKMDIRTATDLQRIVPSLNVTGSLSRNEEDITLRGLRKTGDFTGAGGGPAVVSYFAEVPARSGGPGLYMDLQNVQVLKGPQGTLFGRNTTGGAILLQPRRPDSEVGGYLRATLGDFGRIDTEGAINLPVVEDTLMMRFAAQKQTRDGFTKDVNTGREYDNRDNWTARLSVLYTPNDQFENYAILWASEYEENGYGFYFEENNPNGPFASLLTPLYEAQQQLGIRDVALSAKPFEVNKSKGVVNRTEYNVTDNLSLINIFSYSRQRGGNASDLDGTILPINDLLGPRDGNWNPNDSTVTEELQFHWSTFDDALELRLGGYYEKQKSEGAMTFAQHLSLGFTSVQQDAQHETSSKAVFVHGNLDVGAVWEQFSGLNIAAGYRSTKDEFSQSFDIVGYPGIVDPIPTPTSGDMCLGALGSTYPNCLVGLTADDDGQSWDLSVDYALSDNVLLYASYRRGYKSGGFNSSVGGFFGLDHPAFTYGPENVDSYELGAKMEWSVGSVSGMTNIAFYTSDYQDVQVKNNLQIGPITTSANQNAASATINGLEIEAVVKILNSITLTVGYSYTDAAYDDYITPAGEDLSGLAFQNTPKQMVNLGITYDYQLPRSLGYLSLDGRYSWQDDMFSGFTADDTPGAIIDDYNIINLRASWNQIAGSGVDASIFVNNLNDTEYRVSNLVSYNTTGQVLSLYGEPRMWGVSFGIEF